MEKIEKEASAHRDGGGDGERAGDARGGDGGGGDDGADEGGEGVGALGRGREGHVHAQAMEEAQRPLPGLRRRKPLRIHRRRQRHLSQITSPVTFTDVAQLRLGTRDSGLGIGFGVRMSGCGAGAQWIGDEPMSDDELTDVLVSLTPKGYPSSAH